MKYRFDIKFKYLDIKAFYLNAFDYTAMGIVRYYFYSKGISTNNILISSIARTIIDASNCLRTTGVSFIILISGNEVDIDIQRNISRIVNDFLDVSLVINYKNTYNNTNNNNNNYSSYNIVTNPDYNIINQESLFIETVINQWQLFDHFKLLDMISVTKEKNKLYVERERNFIKVNSIEKLSE